MDLGRPGISPFVTPTRDFYRIDTALLAPRVDPGDWSLTIDGDVPEELTLDIDELLDYRGSRPQAVFDGDLDGLIEAGIRWRKQEEQSDD